MRLDLGAWIGVGLVVGAVFLLAVGAYDLVTTRSAPPSSKAARSPIQEGPIEPGP